VLPLGRSLGWLSRTVVVSPLEQLLRRRVVDGEVLAREAAEDEALEAAMQREGAGYCPVYTCALCCAVGSSSIPR
jgi:hypothetical protein